MRTADIERALDFVHREGRVLERRVLDAVFDDGPAGAVVSALQAYRNSDGGFGWGLEPDKRVPDSQPLDVEIAWQSLDWVSTCPSELVEPACSYLASIGPAVGCVTPSVRSHPHAPHWADAFHEPTLNPTAGLAGYLWKWSIDHPWRTAATKYCWSVLETVGPPDEAHTAVGVIRFLENVPDHERAGRVIDALVPVLPSMQMLHYEAGAEGYGVTPLSVVPTPGGLGQRLFPDRILADHLDELEKTQTADGGWEITWPTIGPAAISDWRGRVTLQNLLVLKAYGRVESPAP